MRLDKAMRFTRYTPVAVLLGTMLLAPVSAPAASNQDMLSLQRDVAGLEQQIQDLQKALLDPKTGTVTGLQTMVQQALEASNKTNNSVNSLNTGMMQTLQNALKGLNDQLNRVTELSVTVNNMAGDLSNLQSSVKDLQTSVNRQGSTLDDIVNQIKLLQAPAAAPPPADAGGSAAPDASIASPPSGQTLFNHAVADQNSGKPELALPEYSEFLRLYPDDPNAARAQYYIGEIHYHSGNLEQAVKDFDAVSERYPSDQVTIPDALLMKGMALKKENLKTAAITTFRDVIKQFPGSDQAAQASTELHSLVSTGGAKRPAR